jgi:hypothetical protein
MKKLLMILAIMAVASTASAQLVITGLVDGPLSGGVPKCVELYACGDIGDLSLYGLGSANNGGGTDGVEYIFPADVVAAGTFIYVEALASANPTAFFDFFGFNADYDGGSAVNHNGDDAIELFVLTGPDPIVVDIFGDINTDGTGEPWDSLDGWAKRNTFTGPDGSTFVLANWTFSGIDALDGAATNADGNPPFPLGGYECDPTVPTDTNSWGNLKSLYR